MAFQKIFQGDRYTNNYKQYVADTPDDVKKIQVSSNGSDMGCEVYVISTRKTYILDSKHAWHPKGEDGDAIDCDCVEESTIWEELKVPTEQGS